MRWVYRIRRQLSSLTRREALDAELSEELLFHIERQTGENIKSGMTPRDARRAALS